MDLKVPTTSGREILPKFSCFLKGEAGAEIMTSLPPFKTATREAKLILGAPPNMLPLKLSETVFFQTM